MLELVFSKAGLAAIVTGYLLGSIPFGLLLTRAAGLGDVRKIGSGNIGATNVLRTGNKGLAALTLLLDALKATAAVFLVFYLLKSSWRFVGGFTPGVALTAPASSSQMVIDAYWISAFAGVAALVGHVFPVWLGFKGGKGVATYIGAMLGFFWPGALFFCGVWLVIAGAFRISSLAALVASLLPVLYALMLGEKALAVLLAIMTALIFYKHEANIRRLLKGEEPKIGAKG